MEIDPRSVAINLVKKLMIGCVVPRPIAVVSTVSAEGMPNVAPFSYFTLASHTPLSLLITVDGTKRDGSIKDTLRNAQFAEQGGIGEFVINVADESYADQMAKSGESIPYGESEFDHTGLTPVPSHSVKPPRVGEASVAFECRTTHIIPIGESRLVVGEVVHIHIKDELIDEAYRIDPDKLLAVGRMAGSDYVRTRDRFEVRTIGRP